MFRRLLVLLVVVIVAVLVALPGWGAKSGKSPYVIGAIFSTTGDNAPLGVPERETVQMLVEKVNKSGGISGHPVKVEFYDDGGSPQQAVQACQKLLANKKVIAIIGPTLSGPSLAITQMCQNAKVPLVSCAASIKIVEPVKPYVFKTAQADSLAVGKIISYLRLKKIKRVGFINDSNAFGSSGRDQWMEVAAKAGIKTVATESFNTADTSMTAQLTKIRAAKPQAIICWGTNPGPAIVAKDVKRLGIKIPLIMSHGIANMKFIELAGSAAEGVIFPAGKLIVAKQIPSSDPQKKQLLRYSSQYTKSYNKSSNTFGGHAWDAFTLVTDAIKKVGGNRAKVRSAIESRKKFVGITGVFDFSSKDHAGLDKNAFALVQIKNGKWALK
ncbi:MAG: ABC transporter substrate-binding protein [Armatimonadota bacterium]